LQGIAYKGEYVFQNSLTYASQAEALVAYAFEDLGIRTYAILYPRNSYGLTFKGLFQQEVEHRGGKVVVSASYTDDQTDFGDVIKGMVRYEKPRDPKEEPKPIINFQAIFIPDDFKRINLVVPQLAYYDIKEVQLLGTNGWNSPDLLRDSGKFCDGF
jgi:branched-chain amino acid transport system substrate-binding protein